MKIPNESKQPEQNIKKKIKVLIIDDSAIVREILSKGLSMDPEIEVVGTAQDVYVARDKIVFLKPDVLTLDIEMPRMDGLEFLKRLMPQYPLPVIIVSSLSKPGASVTLHALENGAIDFVLKPSLKISTGLGEMMEELREKIKIASLIDVSGWKKKTYKLKTTAADPAPKVLHTTTDKIIAIGASTGGVVAITNLLSNFPVDMPGTVIVQHMPPVFTRLFAEKLNNTIKMEVTEAKNGDRVVLGRVLVAPGGNQFSIIRSGGFYYVRCREDEKVNGHSPSVDVLFNSVAKCAGQNAIGVILTGMGKDGARGLLNMKNAGARTFGQDESSSVVYGMPKAALELGGVEMKVHIDGMAEKIVGVVNEMSAN
ncbi:MAG: chemotaxis response regulator protein-glutamate methylesterase [Spirochaetales bacterium]|nr:chemotaxis response regulator protein-glutamate methylesterase [Spirochaetales bacterium]